MKATIAILFIGLVIPAVTVGKEPVKPLPIDSIQIVKIAPQDERAVIKTPDGKMKIIKVGDPIGDHARVVEITEGRIVFEEKKNTEIEKVIIRFENGKQRIERIKKAAEKHPQLHVVKPQEEKNQRKAPVFP